MAARAGLDPAPGDPEPPDPAPPAAAMAGAGGAAAGHQGAASDSAAAGPSAAAGDEAAPRGQRRAGADLADPGDVAAPGSREDVRARDLSPLTLTMLALGIIALVGVAVGVLAIVTHGFRPKTIVTYRPAAVFRLRPGECIDSAPNGLQVTVLSCAAPHDAEVFAVFTLPLSSWPGTAAVRQQAAAGCMSRFGGYVNPQLKHAALAQEYVYPDQAAWRAGLRTAVCEVRAGSGELTGSVRAGTGT